MVDRVTSPYGVTPFSPQDNQGFVRNGTLEANRALPGSHSRKDGVREDPRLRHTSYRTVTVGSWISNQVFVSPPRSSVDRIFSDLAVHLVAIDVAHRLDVGKFGSLGRDFHGIDSRETRGEVGG